MPRAKRRSAGLSTAPAKRRKPAGICSRQWAVDQWAEVISEEERGQPVSLSAVPYPSPPAQAAGVQFAVQPGQLPAPHFAVQPGQLPAPQFASQPNQLPASGLAQPPAQLPAPQFAPQPYQLPPAQDALQPAQTAAVAVTPEQQEAMATLLDQRQIASLIMTLPDGVLLSLYVTAAQQHPPTRQALEAESKKATDAQEKKRHQAELRKRRADEKKRTTPANFDAYIARARKLLDPDDSGWTRSKEISKAVDAECAIEKMMDQILERATKDAIYETKYNGIEAMRMLLDTIIFSTGNYVARGCRNGTQMMDDPVFKMWDRFTPEEQKRMANHTEWVEAVRRTWREFQKYCVGDNIFPKLLKLIERANGSAVESEDDTARPTSIGRLTGITTEFTPISSNHFFCNNSTTPASLALIAAAMADYNSPRAYPAADQTAQPAATNGASLLETTKTNAAAAYTSLANGPVAQNVKDQTEVTSNELSNLAASRRTPATPAVTGQPLTHYHSFFSELLSWKNPRASGLAYITIVASIFAARYLDVIRWAFKLSWMVLGVTVAAEVVGKLALNRGFASQVRPRRYYTVPRETLDAMIGDVHELVNFFVIETQRIVFAENVPASAAAGVAAFISYFLVKLVPYWGLTVIGTTVLFFVPLVYTTNQELIDHHLQNASNMINSQTTQVRDVAQKQIGQVSALGKQYAGDYTGKVQDMLRGRSNSPEVVSKPNFTPAEKETQFTATPKFPSAPTVEPIRHQDPIKLEEPESSIFAQQSQQGQQVPSFNAPVAPQEPLIPENHFNSEGRFASQQEPAFTS
ncbi:hypothetical protein G7046_g6084 [Stylonectria norvegica]|nr:hypothetical protein G7046_g6084 [Stylonectria norvegica]